MTDGASPLPGILRWNLGDLTVTVLNDGWFEAPLEALVSGIDVGEASALQAAGFRGATPRVTLNAFLVTGPGRKPLLIDSGYGRLGPDTLGRVSSALALTGVKPEEIETVLLTHLHPDHAGGLLNDEDGARYPNAGLVIHSDETAHWLPDEALARAPDVAKPFFEGARKALAPYADRITEHRGGEVAPGITAIPLPGHTPGHTAFRIESDGKSLLMWTDVIHLPAIQFKQPEAGVAFDVDVEKARAVRKRILDEVATDRTLIAGSHLEFPALGYVDREGAGYRFVPELWVSGQQ